MSDHSETQAVNEMAAALHEIGRDCTPWCQADPTISHGATARALFGWGWRPAWWFHNPDGSLNGRPAVPYDTSTGRAQ